MKGSVPAAQVEHLGITTVPGERSLPRVRSSEDDLCHLAAAVKCLPGGIPVRERLLAGLVLPKVLWSAPLVPADSAEVSKAFFRSIRGPCTWWCQGRIWADPLLRRAAMMSVLLQRPTTAMAYALSRVRWSSAVWLLQGLMPRAVKGLIFRPRATLFGSAGRKGSVVQASPTLPFSVVGPSKPGRDASGAEMPRYTNVHVDTLCVQHGTSFKSAQGSRRCAAGCNNSTGLGLTLDASPDVLTRDACRSLAASWACA